MNRTLGLLDIENLRDRYATYRRLRATAPALEVQINDEPNIVVTRFRDVDALLKDSTALVQPSAGEYPGHIGTGAASVFYKLSLPHMDPPDHGDMRKILLAAFNYAAIQRMQTMVTGVIESALDAIEPNTPVEVVKALAARIPSEVACGMLHVPAEKAAAMFGRVDALSSIVSHTPITEEALRKANEAAAYYFDFFDGLAAANRSLPDDDLVGALVKARDRGLWSSEALATTLMGLFIASYHTTKTAISNALHAFATHPPQYELLRNDAALCPAAWEELLRFDSPVHFVHRYASVPMSIAGRSIVPRTRLLLGLASANRDDEQFVNADVFDIRRSPGRHLSFAYGRHFCAGAQLSRLEGKLLFEGLARRFARLHPTGEAVARGHDLSFPVIERLTLEFEPN